MVRLRLCHVSRIRPAIVGDLEPRSTTVANHQKKYDYVTRRREQNQDLGIGDVELSQGHHHE